MSIPRIVILRSNPIQPDPRAERIARTLVRAGFKALILGWDRSAAEATRVKRRGVPIILLPIKAAYGRGLANFPALLHWQVHLFIWLLTHRRAYQAVHACDFDTVLPAYLVSRLFGKKVVYDIFDFYADHLRATPQWVKRAIRWLDLKVIGRVDAVILVDEIRQEQIAAADSRQVIIIYNTPEEAPSSTDVARQEADDRGLRLAYIGLLHVERGLLPVLELLARHADWHLNLAGFGGDEALIVPRATALPNVLFHGRVPYSQALEMMAESDVLLALYDPTIPNHRYASPNKIFEAMMLGKPVVVAEGTHADEIVAEAGCGLIVPYGNLQALECALEALAADPAMRRRLGDAGREAYRSKFSWEIMARRLISLYNQLIPLSIRFRRSCALWAHIIQEE